MLLRGVSWNALLVGTLVYAAVFIVIRQFMTLQTDPDSVMRLGLLLFALPGAVTALMSRENPLTLALLGALLATPVCLAITHMPFFSAQGFWQEMAWLSSAMFWCVMGALTTMLWRELLWLHRQRQLR
ncbi:inner membrane protein YbjM [Pantoea sp. 1.19]|uniref:inner membrane protein YbjM n=1 Tax=Pantoea sp. 1.19 TaxID=1925589 RepID=UPI000948EB37|nr:inner membrane protein YbjM [Pantoea sp. 1.19]